MITITIQLLKIFHLYSIYIVQYKNNIIKNLYITYSFQIKPTITTMTTLKKNKEDEDNFSYLIVGVDEKLVYVINPIGCQVIEKV